jgi:hypothetical protein
MLVCAQDDDDNDVISMSLDVNGLPVKLMYECLLKNPHTMIAYAETY